jgi:hypothetical protein
LKLTAKTCKKLYLQQLDGSHTKISHLEAILIQSMKQKVKSTALYQHGVDRYNISHKNQEISNLTIKKNQSKVNSSTSHREFQIRKNKTENKGSRNKN